MLSLRQGLDRCVTVGHSRDMRERLISIQKREGWTDAQMAERLRISRPAWNMIRNDKLSLSDRVQMAAARAFPELLGELLTSVTLSGPTGTREAA